MTHKIIVIGFSKFIITGVHNIVFDSYWSAKQYLSNL